MVIDLKLETKGFQFESSNWLCAEVNLKQVEVVEKSNQNNTYEFYYIKNEVFH